MTPVDLMAAALFWISLSLLVYSYALYPIVVYVAARFRSSAGEPPSLRDEELPSVSFLIAAYNESDVIAERIQNALAVDYPRDRYEVVIASDGSTDGTNAIVESAAAQSAGVRLLAYVPRSGKSQVLNRAIPGLRGDVIVLSDANTYTRATAVRNLARWFKRPEIGTVCGRLQLIDPSDGRNADGLYWKYENFLKASEGRLGALLGANGGIYAIRREAFCAIPPDTLVDDFTIPLTIVLEKGLSIVYDSTAEAVEETPPDMKAEFGRRVRIGRGGFQCIARLWRLLDPRLGWRALAFLSHKVLRWCGPFLLIGIFAGSIVLLGRPFFRAALATQLALLMLAALGRYAPGAGIAARAARLPALFTSVNLGLLFGFWRWIRLQQKDGAWDRTAR